MKILRITILATIMMLSLVVPSYAALTNYVTYPRDGFEAAVILESSTYTRNDYWFWTSSRDGYDWTRYSGDSHSGTYSFNFPGRSSYALTGSAFTVVNMPNQGTNTFTLSFWTKYNLSSSSNTDFHVYGSVNQPANGSNKSQLGTEIISNQGSASQRFTGAQTTWVQKTYTFTPSQNYSWFSIVFDADTGYSSSRYFRVDDISMVPIPPAALLLASGLIGLVGIRRFRK